jgi:CDP-diacylglycerol---glycerol-3-phosphate 3-phosphatidyltransferase
MNVPIFITMLRMALIPVFVVVYVWPGSWTNIAAAAVFGLAALTDWLDGYLARRLKQTTRFGAFLDPVADKLVIVSAIVMMVGDRASMWLTLPGLVIVGREIVVSALREWMAEMNRRGIIAVSPLGKVKTGVQIAAILVLLAFPPGSDPRLVMLGYALIYLAAIMTLISMVVYLRAAWPTLRDGLAGD